MFFKEEVVFNIEKIFLNPCSSSIYYTIGTVDQEFGLTEDNFLLITQKAAEEWNNATNKELFLFDEEKGIKVNLLYDYRQDTTLKIEEIKSNHHEDRDVYSKLIEEYNKNIETYTENKNNLEVITLDYNQRIANLEKDISLWNKSKKRDEEEYNKLNQEKEELENIFYDIKKRQEELRQMSSDINYLVEEMNKVGSKLNINVDQYNTVASTLNSQFEQGSYISSAVENKINIYQFVDEESLLQVLIHEFGHALGLEHSTNPDDIMYWINTEEKQVITESSLNQLNAICGE
jgi:chromosome segregation ATPase